MKTVDAYVFGGDPEEEFESGLLTGFDRDALSGHDYESVRAKQLYSRLEASMEDDEYTLGVLPDGRWALVGITESGYKFAVEAQ